MKLKIQINLSQDPVSPSEPAPFDPVKIRNFLLLTITLLSLIGFGVYSLWTQDSEPSSTSTLNASNNALSSKTVVNDTDENTAELSQSDLKQNELKPSKLNKTSTPETLASTTLADETLANKINSTATNATNTEVPKNVNVNNEEQAAKSNIPNIKLETKTTENSNKEASTTKAILAIASNLSEQETEKTEPELAAKVEAEIETVDKVEQKKANLLTSNQITNNAVHRAQLTSNILSREPSDNIKHLSLQEQNKLYLFTEIHGKNNQKIYHRWIFKKKLIAEITLNIRNDQWRTYSSKNFDETMIGEWEAQVVDQNDNILKTVMFKVSR
ncbi:DUF2914 domain-containing protein [Pseudocolwellia sp. AS88]|uniref:DUF2914 domain-containing protein n=1 Tax=Pseudocolwellia sp. AS88 TaxID=3063958 RepID=UPI0026EC2104|nr:DUF2914 domain-containing protein [Pseudocolwellia sp. AS88]MDO7084777.1 DUF2914 domain-containing protein [Pseudocolwellia sp. AS88]